MTDKIIDSIRNQKMVVCNYEGLGSRTIEPHILSESPTGNLLLDAFQIEGYSESGDSTNWKRFDVTKITSYEVLDSDFPTRSDYNPNNSSRYPNIVERI